MSPPASGLPVMARQQPNASPKIRVFLADDELAVLRGLRLLLELAACRT
jgi:hypothetical protein